MTDAPIRHKPANLPFTRKYTDQQIREWRFNYPGLSHRQVSVLTGIPFHTLKALRSGRRRTDPNITPELRARDSYKDKRGHELRLYFIDKAKRLLDVYARIQTEFDATGEFIPPPPRSLDVRDTSEQFHAFQPDGLARLNAARDQRVAERRAERSAAAGGPGEPAGGPPLRPQGAGAGQGDNALPNVLFDRR